MKFLVALSLAGLIAGCVTINIYFPAAAAEKAADKLIDEIWQLKNNTAASAIPPPAAPAAGSTTSGAGKP